MGAIGAPPLTYQWRKNGTNIAGATTPVLSLTGIGSTDAGLYSAVVSNPSGSATSAIAALNVFAPLGGGLMDISISNSPTLRFVPADGFTNTGTAGNTVALTNPTAPFAIVNTGNVSGSWNYRDFASLDLYSPGEITNLDLLETATANAVSLPTLKTTVSGLAPANYRFFSSTRGVLTWENNPVSGPIWNWVESLRHPPCAERIRTPC